MSESRKDDGTFGGGFAMALLIILGFCLGYWVRDQGVIFRVQIPQEAMNPKIRPYMGLFAATLSFVPIVLSLYRRGETMQAQKAVIQNIEDASTKDTEISMRRAKTCIVLSLKTPMVEGAPVYYDEENMKEKGRTLPIGTALCDVNGFTAINSDAGITDIRKVPAEQLQDYLFNVRKLQLSGQTK